MASLASIRRRSRTLEADIFGDKVKFEQKLCILTDEGENALDKLAEVQGQIEKVGDDPDLSDEQKKAKLKEMDAVARTLYEKQILLHIASWQLKQNEEDTDFIRLDQKSLRAADIPLEVYAAIFKEINETPLVPKA